MQNSHWIAWKTAAKASNLPSQDIWNFTPVSYRTSALWGRCPALTPLLQLITPSRASGTADHVRSLDDLYVFNCLTYIKRSIHLSHIYSFIAFEIRNKTELNELNKLECSKTPLQMSSYAHKHVSCICMPKQTHSSIYPTQNQKKRLKKIQLEFFIKKTLSLSRAYSRPGGLEPLPKRELCYQNTFVWYMKE